MTAELPDDIEQLKQMLAKRQHENQVLSSKNKDLENRLNIALEQLKLSRSKQYGQRSEKMPKGTFNEAEQYQSTDKDEAKPRRKKGRKPASKSYMWVYRSCEFSDVPVVIYDYQPSRARRCPETFLAGYTGYLQCDGYGGYDNLDDIVPVGCWAHARRKFHDALTAQPKKTGKATVGLNYIQKLYAIEKQAKALPPDKRKALRREKAAPILTELHEWLEKSSQTVTPKSKIGVAVGYALNQWSKLCRYLESGVLGIDNNVTERDIRPFTTGRKNWMFSQSVDGAKASAALYSLVMTCRANDINLYLYFQKLFTELPQRDEFADLSDLLPWNIDEEA